MCLIANALKASILCRWVQWSGLCIGVAMVVWNIKINPCSKRRQILARVVHITSSSYVIGLKDLVCSAYWLSNVKSHCSKSDSSTETNFWHKWSESNAMGQCRCAFSHKRHVAWIKKKIILSCVEKHAPLKSKRVRKKTMPMDYWWPTL